MIKYQIGYGLKILFIGINPHPGSYRRGVPFSNLKMFWYLLHDSGLIAETREFLKNDVHIKHFYENVFKDHYKFGLINIVDRPTRTATEVKKSEADPGRERIKSAIKKYKPQIVCFIGKITYSLFIQSNDFTYGWQPEIAESKVYVAHTPHRGPASERIADFKEIMRVLKQ